MPITAITVSPAWNSAPSWIQSFYSKFPLVILEQEDRPKWTSQTVPELWITPSSSKTRPWASADAECLRTQLLFLLRGAHIAFRPWHNPSSAPGGTLPALHLATEKTLLPAEDIRQHLDDRYPLSRLQGMPDQATHDRAVAVAQLVLGRLSSPAKSSHLDLPIPPVLSAGLTTPLPASLTGDCRLVDGDVRYRQRQEAWETLTNLSQDRWALGAKAPTPLDALLAAYIFTSLDEVSDRRELVEYADRVMNVAEASLR